MITENEFKDILSDTTKRIEEDITWFDDEDHSPAKEFRARVINDNGDSLHLKGWFNPYSGKLSYTLIR